MGFGDDDHVGLAPRVSPVFEGAIERGDDEAGIRLKRPFKEFVRDPGRPWGRFVGGGGEGLADFVLGDTEERSSIRRRGRTTTIIRLERSARQDGMWTTGG